MTDAKIVFSDEKVKHTARIARLSKHKRAKQRLLKYIKKTSTSLTPSQIDRYTDCHSYLVFKNYFTLNKIKLSHAEHCDIHLLCPLCAIRRAAKKVQAYGKKVEDLVTENPSFRLFYVVLTVLNKSHLSTAYKNLTSGQKVLMQRRREAQSFLKTGNEKHRAAANSLFAKVAAGAYSIEVKRGKNSKLWHPHTNFVLLTQYDIDQKELAREWKEITGDSHNVFCKEIIITEDEGRAERIKDVMLEIFKYAMKFSEMKNSDMIHAWEMLKKRRLTGSFGLFRGLDTEAEVEESDQAEFEEIFYRFIDYEYRQFERSGKTELKGVHQ